MITTEQMLDAYSSIGMPLFYKHWSFGKHFARNEALYRTGMQGLAYEIVINSNPCISYIMEENTATMQTLVIAHAAFGHNHFFKNNYLFKQWTDADGILDYLEFAKGYIAHCEERYGEAEVERVLDAAHALMSHGVHRYPRKRSPTCARKSGASGSGASTRNRCSTISGAPCRPARKRTHRRTSEERRRALLQLPEENLLYFLEKTAPRLQPWQREILRIVRMIAQYFYPQRQTKVMNEGCATFVHHRIMNRLHEKGLINDGNLLEFLHSHTNVVFQPDFDDPRYSGINPYALGFAMMQDIERICPSRPTRTAMVPRHRRLRRPLWRAEGRLGELPRRELRPPVPQPRLIRKFGLFHLLDDADEDEMVVAAIHDERGYRRCAARWPANTTSPAAIRTSRSSTSTSPATAASSSATRSPTASRCTPRTPNACCSTSPTSGATTCG